MEQAMSGLRVLDFGQYIPGPYAAMLLAEQGADVIKIERPGGDPQRSDPAFKVWNRSKKGMVLDLKDSAAVEAAHELIRKSDVLIENYKPGVADRLGIGYEAAKKINPSLVYCSISGYGQTGPYRDRPGWDSVVTSASAVYAEQGGGIEAAPTFLVLPLASYYSAFQAAYSIALSLYVRESTGRGQHIDVSMMNSIMGAAGTMILEFEERIRLPYSDPQGQAPLYKLYKASDDKWFFLGLGNFTFFTKFAIAMGHEEWLVDERFEGAPFLILPPINWELIPIFEEIFATKTRDEWLEFLKAEDIPCAPAQHVESFMQDPQVAANNMVVEIDDADFGKMKQMGVPIKLSDMPGQIQNPAPALGQDTGSILKDLLEFSDEKIDKLTG